MVGSSLCAGSDSLSLRWRLLSAFCSVLAILALSALMSRRESNSSLPASQHNALDSILGRPFDSLPEYARDAKAAHSTVGRIPVPSKAHHHARKPSPAPSTSARRYLHLLSSPEGMSGWLQSMREAMQLAQQLGRVFVLPCVRAGILVPCHPSRMLPVPGNDRATAEALAADPALDARVFPAFRNDCPVRPIGSRLPSTDHASFPLTAYFTWEGLVDLAASATGVPRHEASELIVSSADWHAALVRSKSSPLLLKRGAKRGRGNESSDSRHVFLNKPVIRFDSPCAESRKRHAIGPYVFLGGVHCLPSRGGARSKQGRGGNLDASALTAHPWASQADIFTFDWYRGDLGPAGPLPAIHPAHIAAALRWVAGLPGASEWGTDSHPSYSAVQWRSETLSRPDDFAVTASYETCAAKVVRAIETTSRDMRVIVAAASLPPRPSGGRRNSSLERPPAPPVVLVVDQPDPRNPCVPSRYYAHPDSESRLAQLLDTGAHKYDSAWAAGGHWPLDAGALSLREYVLAVHASHFSACNNRRKPKRGSNVAPKVCRQCAWASEYVLRIVQERERDARGSTNEAFLDAHSHMRVQALVHTGGQGRRRESPVKAESRDGLPCFAAPCGAAAVSKGSQAPLLQCHSGKSRIVLTPTGHSGDGGSITPLASAATHVSLFTIARAIGAGFITNRRARSKPSSSWKHLVSDLRSYRTLGCSSDFESSTDGCIHVSVNGSLTAASLRHHATSACMSHRRVVLHVSDVSALLSDAPHLAVPPPGSLRAHLPWLRRPCAAAVSVAAPSAVHHSGSDHNPTAGIDGCASLRVAILVPMGWAREASQHAIDSTNQSGTAAPTAAAVKISALVTAANGLFAVLRDDLGFASISWELFFGAHGLSEGSAGASPRDAVLAAFKDALGTSAHINAFSNRDSNNHSAAGAVQALATSHVLLVTGDTGTASGMSDLAHAALLLREAGSGVALLMPGGEAREVPTLRSDVFELPCAADLIGERATNTERRRAGNSGLRHLVSHADADSALWLHRMAAFITQHRRALPFLLVSS